MKLYYFKDPRRNFGDDLNPWIWQRLLPDFFDDDAETLFIGIGTLLNHRIPPAKKRIVFGSGVGYGDSIEQDGSWDFVCVRGPRSAQALGISADHAVIDPAVFIHELYPHRKKKDISVAFMPHCGSADIGDWSTVCALAGIHYINPRNDTETVMDEVSRTELLLTEAMHGAIAAEAFRIPWVPLRCYEHISEFKWLDWCESLDLPYEPHSVPGTYRGERDQTLRMRLKTHVKRGLKTAKIWSPTWADPVRRRSSQQDMEVAAQALVMIASEAEPVLSYDALLDQCLDRLHECLAYVRKGQ